MELAWLADLQAQRVVHPHKWSPVSRRSSAVPYRESSPIKDQHSTTAPRNQPINVGSCSFNPRVAQGLCFLRINFIPQVTRKHPTRGLQTKLEQIKTAKTNFRPINPYMSETIEDSDYSYNKDEQEIASYTGFLLVPISMTLNDIEIIE